MNILQAAPKNLYFLGTSGSSVLISWTVLSVTVLSFIHRLSPTVPTWHKSAIIPDPKQSNISRMISFSPLDLHQHHYVYRTIRSTEVPQPRHETVTPQPERGIGEDATAAPHSPQQSTARWSPNLVQKDPSLIWWLLEPARVLQHTEFSGGAGAV